MNFWKQPLPFGRHSSGILKKLTRRQAMHVSAVNPKKALMRLTLSMTGMDMRAATTSLTLSRMRFLLSYSPR